MHRSPPTARDSWAYVGIYILHYPKSYVLWLHEKIWTVSEYLRNLYNFGETTAGGHSLAMATKQTLLQCITNAFMKINAQLPNLQATNWIMSVWIDRRSKLHTLCPKTINSFMSGWIRHRRTNQIAWIFSCFDSVRNLAGLNTWQSYGNGILPETRCNK